MCGVVNILKKVKYMYVITNNGSFSHHTSSKTFLISTGANMRIATLVAALGTTYVV